MNGGIIFLIIFIFAVIFGFAGWTLYARIRAKRLGLPPPSLNPFARSSASSNYPAPAPGGIQGFFQTQVRKFKNRNNRSAAGAYEEPSGYAGRGRGSNRLDPDEAWDSHVGNEAYYEEQELGLHAPQHQTPYGAPSPGFAPHEEAPRGRSRTREYEDQGSALHAENARSNPFGDENASSLRGVSPRPLDYAIDTSYGGASSHRPGGGNAHRKTDSADSSPTESRRSVFRENM